MLQKSAQCQQGFHPAYPAASLGSSSKAEPLLLFPVTQGSDLAHQKVNKFCLGRPLPPLTVLIKALLAVMEVQTLVSHGNICHS